MRVTAFDTVHPVHWTISHFLLLNYIKFYWVSFAIAQQNFISLLKESIRQVYRCIDSAYTDTTLPSFAPKCWKCYFLVQSWHIEKAQWVVVIITYVLHVIYFYQQLLHSFCFTFISGPDAKATPLIPPSYRDCFPCLSG